MILFSLWWKTSTETMLSKKWLKLLITKPKKTLWREFLPLIPWKKEMDSVFKFSFSFQIKLIFYEIIQLDLKLQPNTFWILLRKWVSLPLWMLEIILFLITWILITTISRTTITTIYGNKLITKALYKYIYGFFTYIYVGFKLLIWIDAYS